ncbi:hypothetical protein BDZ89DRAFT_554127 [Hymenopellis radicata]|nr:hypothetical protein BDZ89DRAFT_554127 [Hymenopellis radicata]
MDRIPYDPALERCPDFAGPKHQRARAYLIADAALADITTDEEAAQHLRDEWTTENNEQRTLYQQQVEADKAVEEQRVAQEQDAFLPTSSARPSKNAIPDVLLTWAQLLEARTLFLQSLHLGNFPQSHVAMFSEFYANMEMHAYAKQEVGRLALVRYHALALEDWYDRNRQGDPFNLALIDEARLRECKEDIRDKKGRTQDTVFERKMSD